ncbi:MAG: hypothetical protein EXS46_01455 [Candidatus Taylorbacteria bacterium]|nr:hypothetical protein [Candidatus Taylorbacteria bacterium]
MKRNNHIKTISPVGKKESKNKVEGDVADWNNIDDLIADIRQTPLSKSEVGAVHVAIAEAYLDVTNNILAHYKQSLEETVREWKKLDEMRKNFDEKYNLAKVRLSLSSK